jgi:hypothetical protein
MGVRFADQYSILHGAVGVVLYFWSVPFLLSLVLHTVFEVLENTKSGMSFINRYFVGSGPFQWPGGKEFADTPLNMFGDTVWFSLGWGVAYWLDALGTRYRWHRAP